MVFGQARGGAAAAAVAVLVLLGGCGGPAAPAQPTPDPTAAASTPAQRPTAPAQTGSAGSSPSPTPSITSEPMADVTVIVTQKDGKIVGGVQIVKVTSGKVVELAGSSDTPDSLHVHGYDKTLELGPGKRTSITFTADVKGVFEIETHETAKLAAKLVVS